jgi:2-iminobutanoate/2-iminopropanoate deaminase
MPRIINPRDLSAPASGFAHGLVHSARARRLVTSGLMGITPDGTVPDDLQAQLEQAFDNLEAILREAGMNVADLVNLKLYSTVPGSAQAFRQLREKRLGPHRVTASYLEVSGLAAPEYLIELEAEAICEEGEMAFLDFEAEISTTSGRGGQMAGSETKKGG